MYYGKVMSSISQWLRMEEIDRSEPAGFYVAGATKWRAPTKPPPRNYEEWEIEEFVDRWEMDEQ